MHPDATARWAPEIYDVFQTTILEKTGRGDNAVASTSFSLSGNQHSNLEDNATSSAPRLPTNATADQVRHRADPIRVQYMTDSDTIELTAIRKNAVAAASTALTTDLETGAGSCAASIHSNEGNEADAGRTVEQRRKSLIHFAALCWCLLVNGWNEATTGPMIPRVQERYDVGFLHLLFYS